MNVVHFTRFHDSKRKTLYPVRQLLLTAEKLCFGSGELISQVHLFFFRNDAVAWLCLNGK